MSGDDLLAARASTAEVLRHRDVGLSPSRSERSSRCSSTASRWCRRSGERFDDGLIIAARSICAVRCAPSCVPAANLPDSAAGGPAYGADESSC